MNGQKKARQDRAHHPVDGPGDPEDYGQGDHGCQDAQEPSPIQ